MRLETTAVTLTPPPAAPPISPQEFISTVQGSLCAGKVEEALQRMQSRWLPSQITPLLKEKCADVRKVAALALALIGDRESVSPLAVALHDADAMVVEVAEHALWSIWFRLGASRAVCLVKSGNTHMHHGNFVCAIEKFSQAIAEDASFAEAHNQRAIAYYLSEQYAQSIADCKAALARMPQHFGAMSGMGHCHAHVSQWSEARHAYRLALAIHPRLEGIQQSLEQVEQLMKG